MAKIIDNTNLGYLISKIKSAFWPKTDVIPIGLDVTPTNNSSNLVTSGGVYSALENKYEKPSTGIPATDLASAVQTSLGKADTALQSYTETDPVYSASAAAGITSSDINNWNSKTSNVGTITGITMNGSSKGTSGVVNLGTVVTSETDPVFTASAAAGITSNDITSWNNKVSNVQSDWNATSGLAQILNKPTIPAAVTESTVSGWGFTKNAGTVTSVKVGTTSYNPSSGIVSLPAYPSVPSEMTTSEATTGTSTTARTISASVLTSTIDAKITTMTQTEVDTIVNTIFS